MQDSAIPSPAAASDGKAAKPPEKQLADALRETFQNLGMKDVTPDVIIKRFNKSGGIDRVRIAIERRMKQFSDTQKHHTVTASEEFLNDEVPEGSAVPPRQKLMQRAQDVVLASVKERIGRDVDSITEQGKASWFLACVRDEIINACKEHETTTKTEEKKPAPPSKVVDGAKAILKNLTRNVVRPRHMEHGHDSVKVNTKKEHTNGHTRTNGKPTFDEKNKPLIKGNQSRSESMPVFQKKESIVEGSVERDHKESKVSLDPPRKTVDHSPQESARRELPSSCHPLPIKSTEQPNPGRLNTKHELKEVTQPIQRRKGGTDYDALAEEILLGGSSNDGTSERKESKSFGYSVSHSAAKVVENISDKKAERQKERTASRQEGELAKQSEGSVFPSPTSEVNDEGRKRKQLEVAKSPNREDEKLLNEPRIPEPSEAPKVDTDEKPSMEDLQTTGQRTATLRQEISGNERLQKDVKTENTSMNQSKPEASSETIRTTQLVEKDAERATSEKDTKLEAEDKPEKRDNAAPKKEPRLEDGSSRTGKTTDGKFDVKSSEEKAKEDLHNSRKERSTEEHHTKSEQKNASFRAQTDARTTIETGKIEEDQQLTPGHEQSSNPFGKDANSHDSDNDGRRGSEVDNAQTVTRTAILPTRRSARRRSSGAMPKEKHIDNELNRTGHQKATSVKKDKRLRSRPKRKIDENIGAYPEGKRKAVKNDGTKTRKESTERKRRRTSTTNDQDLLPVQPSSERPDPAIANWPRGYDIVKSCVPEDFEAQQKVLHALEILLEKDCAKPFSEPVDTTEKGLEMYASIIKNPMDLGEICKRLQNSSAERGYYLNVAEVIQDIELVWWNCKKYNGQFDPIIESCDQLQHELSFLLEQHDIEVGKQTQKRRRVSRGPAASSPKSQEDTALGDNDGRLVGKTILVFTELEKRKKEWLTVQVKSYDAKSKSYTLLWVDKGKTTKKATFGLDKMYPVYRV